MSKSLLLEIGLEELPARFVEPALTQLQQKAEQWFAQQRIAHGTVRPYATPRRLALVVEDVAEQQADVSEEVRGPAKKIALDMSGNWSQAALGFARSQGMAAEQLFVREQNGIEYVYANKQSKGVATAELLAAGLKTLVESLAFAKNMRWGTCDLRYARPIRWLIGLFGTEVIPFTVAEVTSSNVTQGHRFLGKETLVAEPTGYEATLRSQFVIADMAARRAEIVAQIEALAARNGWHVPIDEDLLTEVTSLVEYPTVLNGGFSAEFLQIPQEVLITSMREHQRYFPVLDGNGKMLPFFITVRNGDSRSLQQVAKGNEKVLRARLSDARFFYVEDQKMQIATALAKLENIVYQVELGTIADKVRRIVRNAGAICRLLQIDEQTSRAVQRAAEICKFDLVTSMVYEFPELQGVMGEDYALKLGETQAVARAVKEHYQPRFSGDRSPSEQIGAIVAIADKIDTLVGCFSLGMIPTGSQDPYALRRQTAGIVQIIEEHALDVHISQLVQIACEAYRAAERLKREESVLQPEIADFFSLRLKNTLNERGIRYDVIDAVLAGGIDDVRATLARAAALMEVVAEPTFKAVCDAFTRVVNLASKHTSESDVINEQLFLETVESELYHAWRAAHEQYDVNTATRQMSAALQALASLDQAINRFFESVMVMAEDANIRNNRLTLLYVVARDIKSFADFGKLVW